MNDKLKQLALAVGGSHYPEASEQYLETTVRLVVDRLIEHLSPDRARILREVYLGKFDLK